MENKIEILDVSKESDNIEKFVYEEGCRLFVYLKNKVIYLYCGVGSNTWYDLKVSKNKSDYYLGHIYNKYVADVHVFGK